MKIKDQEYSIYTIPLLSIVCITYNHVDFIKDAIESFLNQDVDFFVEILIHDDASDDGTNLIIAEYEKRYPLIIKPIYQKINQHSISGFEFSFRELQRAQGKYIALCEGDDYWIDNNKLEKQVNFLENNLDYVFCFHNSFCFDQNIKSNTVEFPGIKENSDFIIDDFLIKNNVPTASVIFVREFLLPLPNWHKNILYGDYGMYLLTLFRSKRKAFYMSEVMSVYRLHNNGVFTSLTRSNSGKIKISNNFIELYKYFYYNVFDKIYKKRVRDIISYHHLSIIILFLRNKMFFKGIKFIFYFFVFNPFYIVRKIKAILKKKYNL
jgi:glycosyltransferase involved in cell wall biosynthesis